jgi:hypothetical protein
MKRLLTMLRDRRRRRRDERRFWPKPTQPFSPDDQLAEFVDEGATRWT